MLAVIQASEQPRPAEPAAYFSCQIREEKKESKMEDVLLNLLYLYIIDAFNELPRSASAFIAQDSQIYRLKQMSGFD